LTVVAAVVIAYAGLSQYSSGEPNAKGLAAALSIGPVLLIGLGLIWRWTSLLTALAIAALVGAGLHRYWPAVKNNYEWADLAQQCGVYGLVALSFARSLLAGRVTLCAQLAIKMHGALAPVEIAYMRRATIAWAIFYLSLTAAILITYFLAPLRAWSLFVNFGTFGLIFLAGAADHALRRRLLPRHPRGGILTIIRHSLIG
jgi:uncharacterized membrane protein